MLILLKNAREEIVCKRLVDVKQSRLTRSQDANAEFDILVSILPVGNTIVARINWPENALSPIVVNDEGNTAFSKLILCS